MAAGEHEVWRQGGGVALRVFVFVSGIVVVAGFFVLGFFVFALVALRVPDPEDVPDGVLVDPQPGLPHQTFHVLSGLDVLAAEEQAGDRRGRVGGEGGEVFDLERERLKRSREGEKTSKKK